MFGAKIVCEQCNKKVKAKTSLYRRGSRFCSDPCIATWEAANPPPIARGPEPQLREELAMLIEQAHAEAQRWYMVHGDISAQHAEEAILTNCALYQSYTLRAAPILRALGFANEATLIDATEFLPGHVHPQLLAMLKAVRQRI